MFQYRDMFMVGNLPKPLSQEQTIEYFMLLRAGETKYRNILIEHNIRFVLYYIYENYKKTIYNIDDLVYVGLKALMSAVDYYQVEKGIKFGSYLSACIKHNVDRFISFNYKRSNLSVSIEDTFITINDPTDIITEYEEKELIESLNIILNSLEKDERELINLYFGFNGSKLYTYIELAQMYGVSKYTMLRKVHKIVDKVRQELISMGCAEQQDVLIVSRKNSLYEYLDSFDPSDVDNALANLKDTEYALLVSKFGISMTSDIKVSWTEEENKKFNYILKKLKKILQKNKVKKINN